jgi:hypothetical protein
MSITNSGSAGSPIELAVETLTVNFPGVKADYVQLKQNGSVIYTVYNPQDTVSFEVFDNGGTYTAVAVKGGMSITGTGSIGSPIELAVKTLTVSFAGKADYVQLKQSGGVIYTAYSPQDSVSFKVFDNGVAYDAVAVKGGAPIPCTVS